MPDRIGQRRVERLFDDVGARGEGGFFGEDGGDVARVVGEVIASAAERRKVFEEGRGVVAHADCRKRDAVFLVQLFDEFGNARDVCAAIS